MEYFKTLNSYCPLLILLSRISLLSSSKSSPCISIGSSKTPGRYPLYKYKYKCFHHTITNTNISNTDANILSYSKSSPCISRESGKTGRSPLYKYKYKYFHYTIINTNISNTNTNVLSSPKSSPCISRESGKTPGRCSISRVFITA